MKNGLLTKSLALAGSLIFCAGAAHAGAGSIQTTLSFTDPATAPTYKILMDSLDGNLWNIKVFADPATAAGVNLRDVWDIRIGFYSGLTPASIINLSGSGTTESGGTFGSPDPKANGFWAGNTVEGDVHFAAPFGDVEDTPANAAIFPGAKLLSDGSNFFYGQIQLGPGFDIKGIDVGLQDGRQKFTAIIPVDPTNTNLGLTPEASELAMLLPGLLPIGLVLRRRNAKKSAN